MVVKQSPGHSWPLSRHSKDSVSSPAKWSADEDTAAKSRHLACKEHVKADSTLSKELWSVDWAVIINLSREAIERHVATLNDFIRTRGKDILLVWAGKPFSTTVNKSTSTELSLLVADVQRYFDITGRILDEHVDRTTRDALLVVMILGLHAEQTLPYLQGFLHIMLAIKESSTSSAEISLVYSHIISRLIPKCSPPTNVTAKNASWSLRQSASFRNSVITLLGCVDPDFQSKVVESDFQDHLVAWTGAQLESSLTLLMDASLWQKVIVRLEVLSRGLNLPLGPLVTFAALLLLQRCWKNVKHTSDTSVTIKDKLENLFISRTPIHEHRCKQMIVSCFHLIWCPDVLLNVQNLANYT